MKWIDRAYEDFLCSLDKASPSLKEFAEEQADMEFEMNALRDEALLCDVYN